MDIKKVVLAFCLMVSSAMAESVDPLVEWSKCSKDNECVTIHGYCAPAAVNKRHQQEAEHYYIERTMLVQCCCSYTLGKSSCINDQCTLDKEK